MPAAGAECGTDADFSLRESERASKQVRDVDAGDQQNAAGHRAQHQQRGTRIADHRADFRQNFRGSI